MPRGKRETKFFVIEEGRVRGRPTVSTFNSTPEFKEWLAESEISLTKAKVQGDVMWCESAKGKWVLIFKGYNVAAFNGQVVSA